MALDDALWHLVWVILQVEKYQRVIASSPFPFKDWTIQLVSSFKKEWFEFLSVMATVFQMVEKAVYNFDVVIFVAIL